MSYTIGTVPKRKRKGLDLPAAEFMLVQALVEIFEQNQSDVMRDALACLEACSGYMMKGYKLIAATDERCESVTLLEETKAVNEKRNNPKHSNKAPAGRFRCTLEIGPKMEARLQNLSLRFKEKSGIAIICMAIRFCVDLVIQCGQNKKFFLVDKMDVWRETFIILKGLPNERESSRLEAMLKATQNLI